MLFCRKVPWIFLACLYVLACIAPSALAQTTAPNEWTWVGGSTAGGVEPVTGTKGTPATGNIPGVRYQATTWTDQNGNFWLFGGVGGVDLAGRGPSGGTDLVLNDLWTYNPSTHEWTWITGSTAGDEPGVYGTMGTGSAQNNPGARENASSWTDSNGNLWLFGGYGLDASGTRGVLNDLWKFHPSTSEWTWISGSSTVGGSCFNFDPGADAGGVVCAMPSVYGTLGTASAGNMPGSRQAATTWTDSKGNLWLFGGWSYDVSEEVQYYLNEVWKYNPSTNLWAWMGGSSTIDGSFCFTNVNYYLNATCGEPGVYGTLGTPDSANIPGGRAGSAKWVDSQGNLWLFSGSGFDGIGYFGDPNDLWEFNSSTAQWTWVGGNDSIPPCDDYDCSGPVVYGTEGTPSVSNIPQGRDHAVTWSDKNGNLWFFGGGGGETPNTLTTFAGNDYWHFNPSTKEWTLMGGNVEDLCGGECAAKSEAVYGVLDVPAPGDTPGSRFAPAGWTDTNGNFWLFGGFPQFGGDSTFFNDLWEYQPSTGPLPTTATPTFSPAAGSYDSTQSVAINDATNGATIYYTTDGTTPTINSAPFVTGSSNTISVQHSETLKAIAFASGCLPSAVASATYNLPAQAAPPVISLPTGTYTAFQTVTISDSTPGATIYYTIDGNAPTTSSSVYSGPISITSPYVSLLAVAIAKGYSLSNISSATYTLNLPYAALPTFSVGSGTYNAAQTVTISDTTPGATIYYQINTGYPTTSSPVYNGPITVSSSEVIYAMATAKNYFASSYAGADYSINPLASLTATPTFSVTSGTYTSAQQVTISDTTAGAFIYYTTDGSTPTTASAIVIGPITVSSTETVRAIAAAYNDVPSSIATADYTINLPQAAFSLKGTDISVVPGATTGNTSVITITPSGGFTGSINLSCSVSPVAANNPAICSIPASVTMNGTTAQTVVLTVNSTPTTSAYKGGMRLFWSPVAGTAFSCILLLGGSVRRRKWATRFGVFLLLFSVVGGAIGCGSTDSAVSNSGGSSSGGSTGSSSGTTPGNYVIAVVGTSGAMTQETTFSLDIQ